MEPKKHVDDEFVVDTDESVVPADEELGLMEQPDGDAAVADAELGTWSTNPDYLIAAEEDDEEEPPR